MAAIVIMEYVPPPPPPGGASQTHPFSHADPSCGSAVLQQNARKAAASLLAPLTHLPPTMVIPKSKTIKQILEGDLDAAAKDVDVSVKPKDDGPAEQ